MWKKTSKSLTTELEAYNYALDLLNYRDYSLKDIERKLKLRVQDQVIIAATIKKLIAYGFLDEKRYAQRVFEAWLSKKYYGRAHLKMTLQKKNVAPSQINIVLNSFTDELEQQRANDALVSCLKRKSNKYSLETQEGKAAICRFLYARGFASKNIQKSISDLHGSMVLLDEY